MLIIEVSKEKNLEQALKTLKFKVQKTKQIQELRGRQEYIKPSVKRRDVIKKAQYLEQIKKN